MIIAVASGSIAGRSVGCAEGAARGRHRAHPLAILGPEDALPDPALLMAQRDGLAAAADLVEEEAGERAHHRLRLRCRRHAFWDGASPIPRYASRTSGFSSRSRAVPSSTIRPDSRMAAR